MSRSDLEYSQDQGDPLLSLNTSATHDYAQPNQPQSQSGQDKITSIQAFANVMVALLGAGFLALPQAISESGIFLGVIGLVCLASISWYTAMLLVSVKEAARSKVSTLADVGAYAFGKPGEIFAVVSMIACQLGLCISYSIFIAGTLVKVCGPDIRLSKVEWLLVLFPLFTGLSWLPSLRFLAPLSIVAFVCVLASMVGVYIFGFSKETIGDESEYIIIASDNFFLFWGVAAVSYCMHSLAVPLADKLYNPQAIGTILGGAFALSCSLYSSFGVIGYLLFGNSVVSPITDNIDGILGKLIQGALCVVLISAFPLQLFPAIDKAETYIFRVDPPPTKYKYLRLVFRTLMVAFITLVAAVVKDFGIFSSLVGAVTVTAVVFIIPTSCYVKVFWHSLSKLEIAFNLSLTLVLVVFACISIPMDLYHLISGK